MKLNGYFERGGLWVAAHPKSAAIIAAFALVAVAVIF